MNTQNCFCSENKLHFFYPQRYGVYRFSILAPWPPLHVTRRTCTQIQSTARLLVARVTKPAHPRRGLKAKKNILSFFFYPPPPPPLAVCAALRHWSLSGSLTLYSLCSSPFYSPPRKEVDRNEADVFLLFFFNKFPKEVLLLCLKPQSHNFKATLWGKKRKKKKRGGSIWLLPSVARLFCEWTNMLAYLFRPESLFSALTYPSTSLSFDAKSQQ